MGDPLGETDRGVEDPGEAAIHSRGGGQFERADDGNTASEATGKETIHQGFLEDTRGRQCLPGADQSPAELRPGKIRRHM